MAQRKSIALSQVLRDLEQEKLFSPKSVSILHDQDRTIPVPSIPLNTEDPVYAAVVIDNSLSMKPYQDVVIQSQRYLLDAWRGGWLCRKRSLLVGQYLFASTVRQLKEFSPLDAGGIDDVPKLDRATYTFDEYTALYQSVFRVLQDMATYVHFTRSQFVTATFELAVITDGDDNPNEDEPNTIEPSAIKSLIQEMKSKGYLRKSVVIGLVGEDLPERSVEDIRDEMGFDLAIPADRSPAEIRRAFDLVSKSIAQR